MNDFKIYTDGAATMKKVNGEYVRENGGWAFVILNNKDECIYSGSGGQQETTNNAMELMAIHNGIQRFLTFGYRGKNVEICSDSAYCINIFTSWIKGWKANGWTRGKKHEPIENLEIIKAIDKLIEECNRCFVGIIFTKVKGHAGNKWNEKVDKLAVKEKLNLDNNFAVVDENNPFATVSRP